jgi:hypothetical protein
LRDDNEAMGRRRFGLLATTLVALNLFLWLAPPGLALRQSLLARLFGPHLVRLEAIESTGGTATADIRVDRGIVTAQTATDLTLQEADTRVQDIPISSTTRIFGRRSQLVGWRVLVEWPASGPAIWVRPEARPGSGYRARTR